VFRSTPAAAALILLDACVAPDPKTIFPAQVTATDRAGAVAYFAPRDQGAVTPALRGLAAFTGEGGTDFCAARPAPARASFRSIWACAAAG
jgi:hypothetical protein